MKRLPRVLSVVFIVFVSFSGWGNDDAQRFMHVRQSATAETRKCAADSGHGYTSSKGEHIASPRRTDNSQPPQGATGLGPRRNLQL